MKSHGVPAKAMEGGLSNVDLIEEII